MQLIGYVDRLRFNPYIDDDRTRNPGLSGGVTGVSLIVLGLTCQTRKKEGGHRSQVRHVQGIAHTHPARGRVNINDAVLSIHSSTFRPSSVTGSLAYSGVV